MANDMTLSWPVRIIDFEASSLEEGSYPIEVGLAVWPRKDAPVTVWSTLIRPTDDWRSFGHWSLASRRVHGIAMSELSAGMAAQDVAAALNERLGSGLVWCDGGPYDAHWLRTLFTASSVKPSFALGNWSALLLSMPDAHRESVMAALEAELPRHRAGADAEQLMRALEAGMGRGRVSCGPIA